MLASSDGVSRRRLEPAPLRGISTRPRVSTRLRVSVEMHTNGCQNSIPQEHNFKMNMSNWASKRRATCLLACKSLRAGEIAACRELCFSIVEDANNALDPENHYFALGLISQLGERPSFSLPELPEIAQEIVAAKYFSEGVQSILEARYSDASSDFRRSCLVQDSGQILSSSSISAFAWLATSLRKEWMKTPQHDFTRAYHLEEQWRGASKRAVRASHKNEDEQPHAEREFAWFQVVHGGGQHSSIALRSLKLSVASAQRLGMLREEYLTLRDWRSMIDEYQLQIHEMNSEERDRLAFLRSCDFASLGGASDLVNSLENTIYASSVALMEEVAVAYSMEPHSNAIANVASQLSPTGKKP
jgi:hypothetical protein